MQLSAANLLLAAQQTPRQVPQPKPAAFEAALAAETKDFAPLDFKQTAPAAAPPMPGPAQRPGATLDIRV
ncbi:MAG TPA: hypothetical protein VG889_00640 [Rhizomicrobium sp.]|nr:hypothetical protein [Rhizomicrobium sp.]